MSRGFPNPFSGLAASMCVRLVRMCLCEPTERTPTTGQHQRVSLLIQEKKRALRARKPWGVANDRPAPNAPNSAWRARPVNPSAALRGRATPLTGLRAPGRRHLSGQVDLRAGSRKRGTFPNAGAGKSSVAIARSCGGLTLRECLRQRSNPSGLFFWWSLAHRSLFRSSETITTTLSFKVASSWPRSLSSWPLIITSPAFSTVSGGRWRSEHGDQSAPSSSRHFSLPPTPTLSRAQPFGRSPSVSCS